MAGGLRTDYLITRAGKAHCGLPGGNALFAAAGAAMWANDVAPWARFGRNFPRSWLITLSKMGLNTSALIEVHGDQDHRTFFAYTPDGKRDDTNPSAHFARIGEPLPEALQDYVHSTPQQDNAGEYEPLAIRPADWPSKFNDVTAVHLAPLPLATHLHVPSKLRDEGVQLITVDPGERYMVPECISSIRSILPQIDVFLPSDMEVRSLLGSDLTLWQAAELFGSWGASLVVIKVGARGVLVYDSENGHRHHLLPYHNPNDACVIDVTGAGDAFCGGFAVGLAKTANLLLAAQMGLVSASLVIEGYGALFALAVNRKTANDRLQLLSSRGPNADPG